MQKEIPAHCDVVIIGGGLSGASAAYHLSQSTNANIIVLEKGRPGEGADDGYTLPPHTKGGTEKDLKWAHASGTAVMANTSTIKMMTQLFASNSADFIKHHGRDGVARYLSLSNEGLRIEKALALKLLPDPENQFRNLGALYLARDAQGAVELREEFETLTACGAVEIEWWDKEKVSAVPDCPVGTEAAIFLANDAIINSQQFSKSLLQAAVATGKVRVFDQSPEVTDVWTHKKLGCAITELATGARIVSQHAVVATGGLFCPSALAGILRPCWSYLVSVPGVRDAASNNTLVGGVSEFSPNMYTWGFTHDWCWTNGAVRCSGEDHYSALKPPRADERCASLANWVRESYPHVYPAATADQPFEYDGQYGVYSETPDSVPIIGHGSPSSRVCYLLGCNAWGQAALSYCSSLVPGLLGFVELSAEQKDILSMVTIRRFGLLEDCR